jgi:hypothetical protein
VRFPVTIRGVVIGALQALLLLTLVAAGWLIYRQLPASAAGDPYNGGTTTLQIVLRQPGDSLASGLEIEVNLYPVDIVAVHHEFFSEPRAGKRLEDFIKERMKGRSPIIARLDKQGHGAVALAPGSWWLHAKLAGDEQIEWRLPVKVAGEKQIVELTSQNAYTRSKSF